jgi:hypothetical protein
MHGKVLVVGESDFSFSVALSKHNKIRGDAKIFATSLDSADNIKKLYDKGRKNLRQLQADRSVFVFHGIRASDLDDVFAQEKFDGTVWNFPYPETIMKGSATSEQCAPLVRELLNSTKQCLSHDGRIYLTLRMRQGGTSNEAASEAGWNLEEIAHEYGFEIVDALPFDTEDFPG